jgi:hypothetical protein
MSSIAIAPAATTDAAAVSTEEAIRQRGREEQAERDVAWKSLGWLGRLRVALFGWKAKGLENKSAHVSWLNYVILIGISYFVIEGFEGDAVANLFRAKDAGTLANDIARIVVLIATVFVADYCAPMARSMSKILKIRHQSLEAMALQTYAVYVYLVDTYSFLEWLTGGSVGLLWMDGKQTEIALRVTLTGLTMWFVYNVVQKIPPTIETLAEEGIQITGQEMLRRVTATEAGTMGNVALADQFFAYEKVLSRPSWLAAFLQRQFPILVDNRREQMRTELVTAIEGGKTDMKKMIDEQRVALDKALHMLHDQQERFTQALSGQGEQFAVALATQQAAVNEQFQAMQLTFQELAENVQETVSVATEAATTPTRGATAHAHKPGTPAFKRDLQDAYDAIIAGRGNPTIYLLAQRLGVADEIVQNQINAMKQEKMAKLRGGQRIPANTILDLASI